MIKKLTIAVMAAGLCVLPGFAEGVESAVDGSVKKIDSNAKTMAITTADGADRTFHYVGRTTMHGAEETGKGSEKMLQGLSEGSEVAVHYTKRGSVDTAEEIDRLGKDGLKTSEGTVKEIDRGGKKITILTADGGEQTFHLADRAAMDTGKDIEKGADKSAKVTVYYSERAGVKVAHFFKKSV